MQIWGRQRNALDIPAKSVKCSDHNTNNIHHNVAMSGVTPNIPHFSHYTLYCIIQQVPGSPGYIPTYQPPYNWAVVKAKLFAPRSPRPVEAVPTVTSSYLPRRRWRGVYNYRPADIFMLNLQFSRNNTSQSQDTHSRNTTILEFKILQGKIL